MIRRGFRALATIANVLVIAAVCLVAMYAVRDFARYVNHYPYLATDDSMGNVSYALATEGRYGFVSSPNQGFTVVGRHRAFFNYGPWYFYVGAGIIWLFGYSVAALRSIHPGVILIIALAALWWFGRRAELAAGAIVALALIYAFEVSHWPMIRPDVAVSLFAVLAILAAGRAIETRSPLHWFFAGLMAGCALFTHFIAWALAPASALMLMVSWAFDRPAAWRLRLTQLAALFLGGVSAGVMFYASFGFRMRDHLSLIGGYGQFLESGQAATSYRTVLLRHLSLAFDYLSPAARLSLAIAIAGAAALLAVSWWRSADQRRAMVAVVLPPLAVLACYVISLGTYPNYHQGYTILTQVAAWWCAGSAVAVATMLVAERAAVIADLMRIGLGVALVLVAARHIEVRTPASADRLRMAGEWVGIAQYTDRIAEFIPPRATAWGSLVFASENPGRMQLVQFADGVTGVERNLLLRPAGAMALAPEYLVWGYTENRDQLLLSLRRRRDLFGAAERAFPQFRYRLIGLVAGRPYGTTRIYARRIEARTEPPAVMPVVRAYEASTGTWDSALTGPEHPVFRATDPVTFAAGPGDAPPTSADRSVAGDISEGRLLLRVHVAPTVDASRRVLAASTVPAVPDLVRALGPNASFAPYDGRDGEVFLVHDHPGGPLYISQIDDGHGAAIEGVEIYRIGPPLDVRQRPERPLIDLPPFALWVPFVTPGVRATADSGDLVVEGDASPGNYQIRSPPVRVEPQYRVVVATELTNQQGKVCLGALNATEAKWLGPLAGVGQELAFTIDDTGGFVLVAVNCNGNNTAAVPSRFVLSRAGYTATPPGLYADNLMELEKTVPAVAGSHDVRLYTVPEGLPTPAGSTVVQRFLQAPDFAFQADIAHSKRLGWSVRGTTAGQFSYLLTSKPQTTVDRQVLLATGWVYRGGISVGLLKEGKWAAQVNVVGAGPFTVVIQPPAAGTYEVVVANNAPAPSRDVDVALSTIAWGGR